MKIKIVNKSNNALPKYETQGSAGMDLRMFGELPITLQPMERALIHTGLHIQLPHGYEAQIRSRSGLALKHGIAVLNSPATIDEDYTGEIGIILINLGDADVTFSNGDRVAQLVIKKYEQADFEVVEELESTERGEGGFGHSGVK